MKKDHNLNNPASEPAHSPLNVTSRVHFDLSSPVPKGKLADWLGSLPENATIQFTGISSGKVQFVASWKEVR